MKNTCLAIVLSAALALTPTMQAKDSLAKYPITYTVRTATFYSGDGGGCFMTLEAGNQSYFVKDKGFIRCRMWSLGTEIKGTDASWNEIILVDEDAKGKLHKHVYDVISSDAK